jgi:hypothetical protein
MRSAVNQRTRRMFQGHAELGGRFNPTSFAVKACTKKHFGGAWWEVEVD